MAMKNSLASTEGETSAAAGAIETLGGTPFVANEVRSVGPDGELRTAVVSVKERATPDKYPRRAGCRTSGRYEPTREGTKVPS